MPTNLTFQGQAVSFDVTAKVAAAIPAEPAIILSPKDQDRFGEPDITVTGSCPNDSYVKVFQNNQLVGISPCVGKEFSVVTTLVAGANVLRAQVYNMTDDEGPASPSITVYYDLSQPPSPVTPPEASGTPKSTTSPKPAQPSAPQPGQPAVPGLVIELEHYRYQRMKPHEPWQWNIAVRGGEKLYKVTIDWRDGTVEPINRTDEQFFSITHTYRTNGSYLPLIHATDAAGRIATLQLYADVHSEPLIIPHAQSGMNPLLLWGVYVGGALIVAQLWWWEVRVWHKRHKSRRAGHNA